MSVCDSRSLDGARKASFPTLAEVTAATDDLDEANNAASDGGKQAIMARNAKKATLLSLMRQLAAYVQLQSNGNKAVLLSSGFHTTKTRTPVGPLFPPSNLRLSPGVKSGELILRMNPVHGVTAGYTIQLAESVDGPYADYVTSSKTKVVIAGLTPGKTYWVRACANGAEGPSGWSVPTTAIAT